MPRFDQLISHRFRGFSEFENTIDGLKKALDLGVQIVEFDIRVTHCGTPVIYHDEYAIDENGQPRMICETLAKDFRDIGGTFNHIPTANQLLAAAAVHTNKTCRLLVDIKDFGFETEINALIHLHRLQSRTVYVSWVPNVLYKMAEVAPQIPLCLSHWPENPNAIIRSQHKVFPAKNGIIPRLPKTFIHGQRSGWYVENGLKGELRQIIQASRGSVCLPVNMLNAEIVKNYQKDGIEVSSFSFVDSSVIEETAQKFGLDAYFVDNRILFDQHASITG